MATPIGNYRYRVLIQQPVETKDDFGGIAIAWGTFAEVAASVEPLRGRELWAAKSIQARTSTRIRIRYLPGITPKMRVLFGARIYLIDSIIDPEERHVEMQIMCQEWVAT